MNHTLMNAEEVIQLSPVQAGFPADYITQGIYLNERTVFMGWLGSDFRGDLIADLVDYSGATEWERGKTYSQDDQVIHKGLYYVSLSNDNGLPPTDPSGWTPGDKFQEADYQSLWDQCLGVHFALVHLKPALTWATFEADSGGIMVKSNQDAGRMTVGDRGFSKYESLVKAQINQSKELIIEYICEALQDTERKELYQNTFFEKWDSWKQLNGARPTNTQRRFISYRY